MDAAIEPLARQVGSVLAERGWRVVLAESCTGGWLAKAITDIPGSSQWLDRGFVVYSNVAKVEMLGVDESVLARYGAVSTQVVRALAVGALARSNAHVAVAVSGIAGPGGGSPEKPVGTVCLAWVTRLDGGDRVQRVRLLGDREAVRRQSVIMALKGLADVCCKS